MFSGTFMNKLNKVQHFTKENLERSTKIARFKFFPFFKSIFSFAQGILAA